MPKKKQKDTHGGRPVKAEWTDYENHFWDLCQEKGWKPELEEDDCPVLMPGRSGDCYRVYPHAPGKFGICIMATHAKTKNTVIAKLRKAKIIEPDDEIFLDGDTEAIVLFNEDRLPRAVKTLNLKRKRKSGLPREQLMANLAKANKAREDKNG